MNLTIVEGDKRFLMSFFNESLSPLSQLFSRRESKTKKVKKKNVLHYDTNFLFFIFINLTIVEDISVF